MLFTLSLASFAFIPTLIAKSVPGGTGPVTNLAIVNKNIAPDGFTRSTVLANGQFPGPLVSANKGDNFKINVTDQLTDDSMERSTTIHWHGIFQQGSNHNDGTGMVTQCPIVPGSSYTYDFSSPSQAGTYWYHSHVHTQYCDGLRGPLVIYDPRDPHADLYDVDDESTVITLADWYHIPSPSIPVPTVADSTLVNGLGRYNGSTSPLAVVNITSSKRYRFRVVSMSCASYFDFSIDGHNFTVIEADGVNTQPMHVDSIRIFAGQRYSIVLEANQPVGNYWIRAEQHAGGDGGPTGFEGGINSAILRYTGAEVAEPTSSQTNSVSPLDESKLVPLVNTAAPGQPFPGGADVNINLDLGFDLDAFRFLVNNVSWQPPSIPVLLQILSGAYNATTLLPKGSVITLPPNKVIELSIPPGGALGNPHPFHLHGQTFSVVRGAGMTDYNFVNPVQRDVVSIGDTGDNVTIRFETNNDGPWLLHCHIDYHLEAGLAVVFATDPEGVAAQDHVTPEWNSLCPAYDNFHAQTSS